ncbi:hypothetical protein IMZ68_03570 [Candidatus Bathyarchaeota archaeon]|nr:hypothetical protein [Candidatus Bathyarchaeota archaeon]
MEEKLSGKAQRRSWTREYKKKNLLRYEYYLLSMFHSFFVYSPIRFYPLNFFGETAKYLNGEFKVQVSFPYRGGIGCQEQLDPKKPLKAKL